MCNVLKISRSLVYYSKSQKTLDSKLENHIIRIFKASRNNYGTRKIKFELKKHHNYEVSRRKIGYIMKKYALVSNYTIKQFKIHKTSCNESKIANVVDRDFKSRTHLEVVVSDLTYVNVNGKWNYICVLLDLYNREIIGYSAGERKNISLVTQAFSKIKSPLDRIKIFHTDRGNEFKNHAIDQLLNVFNITRSLSKKGCPYDNAVAEATFKILKTEFVFNRVFSSLEELKMQLFDYVNWYNNKRIHGSLAYLTPVEYRMLSFDKKVS